MNSHPDPLENALRRLHPRAPRADFWERLETAATRRPAPVAARRPMLGLAWPLAATLLLGLAGWHFAIRSPQPSESTQPSAVAKGPGSSRTVAPSALKTPAPQTHGSISTAAPQEQTVFQPARSRRTLRDVRLASTVTRPDGAIFNRYRYDFIDSVTWRNKATGATLRVEAPGSEWILVPARTY